MMTQALCCSFLRLNSPFLHAPWLKRMVKSCNSSTILSSTQYSQHIRLSDIVADQKLPRSLSTVCYLSGDHLFVRQCSILLSFLKIIFCYTASRICRRCQQFPLGGKVNTLLSFSSLFSFCPCFRVVMPSKSVHLAHLDHVVLDLWPRLFGIFV